MVDVVCFEIVTLPSDKIYGCLSSGDMIDIEVIEVLIGIGVDEGRGCRLDRAIVVCKVDSKDIVSYSSEDICACNWSSEISSKRLPI